VTVADPTPLDIIAFAHPQYFDHPKLVIHNKPPLEQPVATSKVGVVAMLVKCANSSCSASFRYLRDGTLFRLERDPTLRSSKSNRVEYFWLCHRCSSEVTLRLREDGTVVTVLLPEPIRGVPDGAAISWAADRKTGLLRHSVSSASPEQVGGRMRARLKDGHAA
jgi:hypothetical protein